MKPDEAKVILEFVMRAQLQGTEARAHVRAQEILLAIIQKPNLVSDQDAAA